MKYLIPTVVIVTNILFSGCGSISSLESTTSEPLVGISKYEEVIVLDFADQTFTKKTKPDEIAEHKENVKIAGRSFADKIAAEIKKTKAFNKVLREFSPNEAIVICGTITRYQEGNAAARLLIGFGAGSSYFDADVRFKDNKTGSEFGMLKVDKNSWVLGGGIAAAQNVDGYMKGAAKKIASELAKAKETNRIQ